MLYIRLFSSFRELINKEEEYISSNGITSVKQLKSFLATRGDDWSAIFNNENIIKVAVNKELVNDDFKIKDGDEIAFFPPVTGG